MLESVQVMAAEDSGHPDLVGEWFVTRFDWNEGLGRRTADFVAAYGNAQSAVHAARKVREERRAAALAVYCHECHTRCGFLFGYVCPECLTRVAG